MTTEEIVKEVWHAFSTLSDAQELIGEEGERASDRINHAKRHLLVVLDGAGISRQTIVEFVTCTLEGEEGHSH